MVSWSIIGQLNELNVVLICDIDNVLANIAAIARSFPVYSRKTDGHTPVTVKVEVCVPDGELVDDDINYLKHLACSIRDVCCMVDTPANELTTEAFLEKATYTAKQLGVKQVTISGEDLRQQGFGGIYCVGKAGPTPPIFTVLSFEPPEATETYCLVGKGVVFDTGGMQIKGKIGMPVNRGGPSTYQIGADICPHKSGSNPTTLDG
ncbi:hypothetical protein KIN20_024337 [Parelaphostrongylus tenuis]|uniref:Cytosol aminopeptidase domain-containing protein n=1 Tax=Parelaphostrongylus tenuis TaxID=148309 RepID=A0AAD5MY58_PARTN|nr:hypothetical protein KIN20_024337 [Parelaphostrongylus tenuis]